MTAARRKPSKRLDINGADHITAAVLGQLVGLSERRVHQLAGAGALSKDSQGRFPWPAAVRECCEHFKSDATSARERKLQLECEKLLQQIERGRAEIRQEEFTRLSEQIVDALETVCDAYRALKIPQKYIGPLVTAFEGAKAKIAAMQ